MAIFVLHWKHHTEGLPPICVRPLRSTISNRLQEDASEIADADILRHEIHQEPKVMLRTAIFVTAICCAPSFVYAETCTASQYGIRDGYHGKKTASGERFNTHALTAAHKTKRFGSHARVTNQTTGRSVSVRITDRGPFVKGRCIDLSHAAANAIGMGGTARVVVQ